MHQNLLGVFISEISNIRQHCRSSGLTSKSGLQMRSLVLCDRILHRLFRVEIEVNLIIQREAPKAGNSRPTSRATVV